MGKIGIDYLREANEESKEILRNEKVSGINKLLIRIIIAMLMFSTPAFINKLYPNIYKNKIAELIATKGTSDNEMVAMITAVDMLAGIPEHLPIAVGAVIVAFLLASPFILISLALFKYVTSKK